MTVRKSGVWAVVVMLGLLYVLYGNAALAQATERSASSNYILRCLGCHGANGAGAANTGIPAFPGLVDPLYATEEGRTYLVHVPGVAASGLNTQEIGQVLNYVAKRWARDPEQVKPFTVEEVRARQAMEVKDIVALRRYLSEHWRAQGVELAPYPWP